MRWGVSGTLLISAVWCVGCAAPPVPPVSTAVGPGQAKISITRESEESLAFAPAQIVIDGARTIDLGKGQTYSGGVAAGPVTLTVGQAAEFEHYTLRFTAAPGKEYAFLVERRPEFAFARSMAGGAVALALDNPASEQSGPFKITAVTP